MKNFTNTIFYRYLMVAIACVIMGIAFNTFYVPNKLLSGGISGLAGILYYTMDLPIGVMSALFNVPLFALGYKYMDKEYLIGALYGMVIFSFSLDFFTSSS